MALPQILNFGQFTSAEKAFLAHFADLSFAQGDIFYIDSTLNVKRLAAGTSGNFLTTQGAGADPIWSASGGGTGTVTSVSVTTANGVSGSVATATTTPAITLTLGAITPTTVNGLTISTTTGTFTLTNAKTLTVSDTTTLATNSITFAGGEVVTFTATNALTLTTTGTTNSTFPAGTKTLLATDGAGTSLTGIPYALTGTANQVVLSASTGNITFSLPQDIATSSAVSFASVATSAASPLLMTNGKLVTIALTSQTVNPTTLTIPNFASVSDTFAFIGLAQEFTNKTLNASVGKGTWTASGTWTLPAITLAGIVSGGGQQLNNIIIGTVTPLAGTFTVVTASKAGLALDVANTTDATSNQVVKVSGVNATRANNDLIYTSYFLANSAGTQKEFGRFNIKAPVVTNTSEDGSMIWSVMSAGTLTDTMILTKTDLKPVANDLIALGTTALMWSDVFLASGAVVNFNNSNVTLTHSAGLLTMAGTLVVTSPKIVTSILDTNANTLINIGATGSAVNYVKVTNAATGTAGPIVAADGETNVDLKIAAKGTGKIHRTSGEAGDITAYSPSGAGTATLTLNTSNIHTITMPAGNITIALSNEAVGQCFVINIIQDSVGSRTVTWFTTIKWAGGSAPTLTTAANKIDSLGFIVSSAGNYYGYIVGQNL